MLLIFCFFHAIKKWDLHTNQENQVILVMITDGKNWHYLTVRGLPAWLRGITSNYDGNFYCLNCFHTYSTEKNLKHMKEYAMTMIIVM